MSEKLNLPDICKTQGRKNCDVCPFNRDYCQNVQRKLDTLLAKYENTDLASEIKAEIKTQFSQEVVSLTSALKYLTNQESYQISSAPVIEHRNHATGCYRARDLGGSDEQFWNNSKNRRQPL
jgi:hypothetical protein